MKSPAQWCIERPVATMMVFVSALVLGGLSSRLLPLELFPEVDFPFLFVDLTYPGSTPDEVEQSLVRPAEEALATLSGVQFMNSRSTPNGGQIFMAFDWRTDLAVKSVEARERLDAIRDELPSDLRRINVLKFNTTDQPVLTLRISSDRDLANSYELLARNLVRPIERLPGVAQARLQGVEPSEIRIELLADRVTAAGIDLNSLSALLTQSNFSTSAGTISADGLRYRVSPMGEFQSLDEISDLVIDNRGRRLSDIATVSYEPRERDYERHLDRHYAIGLDVFKERGSNLVDVAARVVAAIEEAGESRELQGVELFFLEDQANGVTSSLNDLLSAGGIGAMLSLIVLYLFLRNWSTTFMVSLAVPVAITVTLGAMYLMELSLNILSMMGLMLAVGMLVDNAVVVSEAIYTERSKTPDDPVGAASRGVRSVGLAVLAGTLTTMAVFLPNLFGEMDQIKIFMQHVAAAICISLLVSLIIAQTLIPMLTTRIKFSPQSIEKTKGIEKFKERYARFLDWTLGHRWWAWGGIMLILFSVIIPGIFVKQDMFPEEDRASLFLQFNLDTSYSLGEIRPYVDQIEDYLYGNADEFHIDKVYTYFDEQGTAQSSILLLEDAPLGVKEIKEKIVENLPKIPIGRPSFDEQRSAGAEGVSISLLGESSEKLVSLADEVVFALEQLDSLTAVRSAAGAGNREVMVSVDRERARSFGLSAQSVAESIAVALRGVPLTEFQGRDGEVPMVLRFQESDTQSVEQLTAFTLQTPDGRSVPLYSVVNTTVRTGPVNIERTDRQTALGIRATLKGDADMDDAREDIEKAMNAFTLPPGYTWKFGRGFEFQDDTAANMVKNILLAVLFIYLVMAALFESLIHPLSIITGILFSIVGVFWFFLLTNTTFSLMAFIGILILIGVVVNNGIVLVDHINQLRRSGMQRREAVVQGGRDRIRPILMTVGTTVLGLVPLCIGATQLGGDGPPYFPMARAIVGGLVFSTVISLCVLPTIYVTLDDLRIWGRNRVKFAKAWRWRSERPDPDLTPGQ